MWPVHCFHSFKMLHQPHLLCLNSIPSATQFPEIMAALLCGQRLPYHRILDLAPLGLIHLFVVSGAHLLFLENILRHIPLKGRFQNITVLTCLFAYTLISGAGLPILRAFIHRCLKIVRPFLGWRSDQTVFVSILILALSHPDYIDSLSLYLSWTAALSIYHPFTIKSELFRFLLIMLLLTPLLIHFGAPSPLSLPIQFLFVPFFGLFIFPFTLLSYFIHPIIPLYDSTLDLLFKVLHSIPLSPLEVDNYRMSYPMIYCLSIQFIFHIISIKNKRNQCNHLFTPLSS